MTVCFLRVLVAVLTVFVRGRRVFFGFLMLAVRVMMRRLMVVMRRCVVMRRGLVMMLDRRVMLVCHVSYLLRERKRE
jgi:hypothetical protein